MFLSSSILVYTASYVRWTRG